MDLLPGKITGTSAAEEVHIFCCGELPEYGEQFSIPCKERDTGLAFTVSSMGISAFVLNNLHPTFTTTNFTINTYFDLNVNIFATTQQTVRASKAAQYRSDHFRSPGKYPKLSVFRSCSMLRL